MAPTPSSSADLPLFAVICRTILIPFSERRLRSIRRNNNNHTQRNARYHTHTSTTRARARTFPAQVDGPSHFLAPAGGGDRRRPSGATALKRGLLGLAGWRVVSVPHWEWDACAGPASQREYLRGRLQEPAADWPAGSTAGV